VRRLRYGSYRFGNRIDPGATTTDGMEVAIGLTLAIAMTTATDIEMMIAVVVMILTAVGRYDRDRVVERIIVTFMGADMSAESESAVEITLEAETQCNDKPGTVIDYEKATPSQLLATEGYEHAIRSSCQKVVVTKSLDATTLKMSQRW